jgi:hypothetical protein
MEELHNNRIILRVIDPRNISIGSSQEDETGFNLLAFNDLSQCKVYISEQTGQHIKFRKRNVLFSSDIDLNFISLNALRFEELSRRDDIESLGYFMLHFFKGEKLSSGSSDDFIMFKENIMDYMAKFEIPGILKRNNSRIHNSC